MAPTRFWPVARSPILSWRGKLRMALDLVLPRRRGDGDESLESFVTRRLGREALERVAAPLVAGIYTADPARLSLQATMPRFQAVERRHRSLILGLRRSASARETAGASGARFGLFVTLAGGMGELVEALAARLPRGCVQLGCPAVALTPAPGDATWAVHVPDGRRLPAEGVVLAGEAHRTASLLRDFDAELARLLGAIPYASSVTVSLAYPRLAVRHPLDGFGFIVPAGEGLDVLAATFSSVKYPGRAPEGFVLLRAFLGGVRAAEVLDGRDASLVRRVEADLGSLLGITGAPVLTRVARHPRAMPQYEVGHLDRVAAIEARAGALPGLALAGTAYRGVGISDAVRSGEAAADDLLRRLVGR
jgi:oxygen-dependent protoporphyrinogen oxidase